MRRLTGIVYLLIGLAVVAGGWWLFRSLSGDHSQTDADLLLQQVRDVAKLVTNEGEFLEIFSYQDYWGYDIAPLRKKALVRAKGRALIGFDLDKMGVEVRRGEHLIILGSLPEPEILSLEVTLDYYDLQSGTFNAFGPHDLNRMEADIRENMKKKVMDSDLFRRSRERIHTGLRTLKTLAAETGWELRYRDQLHLKALP